LGELGWNRKEGGQTDYNANRGGANQQRPTGLTPDAREKERVRIKYGGEVKKLN